MDPSRLELYRAHLAAQLSDLLGHGVETRGELETKQMLQADVTDRATLESEAGFDLRLRDRDRKLIPKIQEALERIDAGTFGTCEECGQPIDDRRLEARPVTSQCLDCKEEAERRENRIR